uniref:Uncharacterized protein n=1 Tax=uncultured marine virus TaxID=186617 RepID=A0A0F7L1C9_9VIRU|nr:hypothetical protein [uncultured marine virus]
MSYFLTKAALLSCVNTLSPSLTTSIRPKSVAYAYESVPATTVSVCEPPTFSAQSRFPSV